MGNYNPYLPQILGQEWVGIRDETLILNPFANSLERGYSFALPTATTINNVRFYLKNWPEKFSSSMVMTASIYPQGQEAASGPVRSVLIPCSNATITGTNVSPVFAGLTPAQCLFANGDNYFLNWAMGNSGGNDWGLSIFFGFNSFSQLLNNKRILGVDLLLGINILSQGFEIDTISQAIQVFVSNDTWDTINVTDTWRLSNLLSNQTPVSTTQLVRLHLGDANRFYSVGSGLTSGVQQISQWTYPELQRFEAAPSNRLRIILTEGFAPAAVVGPQFHVEYAAMEVFYCEEARVAFGSRIFNDDIPNRPSRDPFNLGMNYINVRAAPALTSNPVLPAGNYTLTISESNMGDNYYASLYRSVAELNEVRQLYALPPQPGVQVNIPFPLNDEAINTTFTSESTDLIPQLTMHVSGGDVITYSHVYGQQSAGQVYGTVTVTQEIDDRAVPGGLQQYPWVRFYARRFGKTTVPLKLDSASPTVSGSNFSVSITPVAFDQLDEIIDGWKAVDLQFPSAPSMGTSLIPNWRFSATGEAPGNRWEVLGVTAPGVSGISFDTGTNFFEAFGQVPTNQRLYLGTYGGAVSGGVISEDWIPQWGPYVSGTTPDPASDATILFSQYMPTITGFSVSVTSQAITGIGLNCGINPCGVPSAILYPQLSWGLPPNTGIAKDLFGRTVSNGLGSPDIGPAYTTSGGAASSYSVASGQAIINPSVASTDCAGLLTGLGPDFDQSITIGNYLGIAANSLAAGLIGRYADANNKYFAYVEMTSAGVGTLTLSKTVASVTSTLASTTITPRSSIKVGQGSAVRLRFLGQGTVLKVKIWAIEESEPLLWDIETTDSSLTTGTQAGFFANSRTATGNAAFFDDYYVTPPKYWFGYYELQRSDTITDWATIMKASSPAITGFKDFEARIGILTSYRIRGVNLYGFAGPWSNTATVTVVAPGVSGTCLTGAHIQVFTTNDRQDGYANLAYSNAWESQVSEDFTFAESGFTQLQPMYDRDFFTAFRPSERGGEQFSRDVLVQAAAISPETLADFTSLRNLAWEDSPYICVRDEDGNRWFASLNVPAGKVQNRRRLYMANVQVIEVTATPAPIDPSF